MEIIEELTEEKSAPVYIPEDVIPDVLALNDLQSEIDKKRQEKEDIESTVDKAEEEKKVKVDEIGIINTGNQIDDVQVKMEQLRIMNSNLAELKAKLREAYESLRALEEDKEALESQLRIMVEEFTKTYNSMKEQHILAVKAYIESSKESDFIQANELADELSNYKEFASFEEITKSIKEESKEVESEFSEVKVNSIEEEKQDITKVPEVAKEEPVTEQKEEVVETSVAPIEEPKEERIEETNDPIVSDVPSFDNITTDVKAVVTPLYIGDKDKIADSNEKGVSATIDVFNPKVEEQSIANEESNVAVLTKRPGSTEPKVA